MQVDIVIVNWNAGPLLAQAVGSIDAFHAGQVERVVVVDNGSTDGSDRVTMAQVPLEIDRAGENLGFARGCNRGAARGRAPWLLFMNPDARLEAGTLPALARGVEQAGERVAAAGVMLVGDDGLPQHHVARRPRPRHFLHATLGLHRLAPARFPWVVDEAFDHRASRDVDHVIGAFYAIRRAMFEELGGFDERFFVYLEDLDLSTRLRARGQRIRYVAQARAFHSGGGTSAAVPARRLSLSLQSRMLFAAKHFPPVWALAIAFATLVIEPGIRIVDLVRRRQRGAIAGVLGGYRLLWTALPDTARLAADMRRRGAASAVSQNSAASRGPQTSSE